MGDPAIRWSDETPGHCVCGYVFADNDDWMEDGNDVWCARCWAKLQEDEDE